MRFLFLLLLVALPLPASAASITYGETLKLNGMLEVQSGSSIKFSDGTVQTSASVPGPPGPQGPQGVPGPAGATIVPVGPDSPYAPYYVITTYAEDNLNEWFTDPSQWFPRMAALSGTSSPQYPVGNFLYLSSLRNVKITYSDNIGIFDTNFCKIAVFHDGVIVPNCVYSFSGVSATTTFNNYTMTCYLKNKVQGPLDIAIKHKSSYCHYGNNPTNDGDFNSSLTIEAF